MNDHAYFHLVGTIVGVKLDSIGIVAATVMTPIIGQDHNDLLVETGDGVHRVIKYMGSYRADFINATLTTDDAN